MTQPCNIKLRLFPTDVLKVIRRELGPHAELRAWAPIAEATWWPVWDRVASQILEEMP